MFANATNEQIARIEEILRLLDQQTTESAANRRRAKRISIHASLSAIMLGENGDASVQLYTRNISTSGIGFVSRRLCKKGERLALNFDLPGKPHKLVLAKVTFCRYVRGGLYDAGAEFLECITTEPGKVRVPGHWMPSIPLPVQMVDEEPRRHAARAAQ